MCWCAVMKLLTHSLVRQQYLTHISSQYGELRPTSSWDQSGSLGHPCKFQRVSRLGSITAWHCSSGRHQRNFAALNRGRHLYWAGWPSRWALAHISSFCILLMLLWVLQLFLKVIIHFMIFFCLGTYYSVFWDFLEAHCTNQCPLPPSPHIFYGPDALPAAKPTASKHWRQLFLTIIHTNY